MTESNHFYFKTDWWKDPEEGYNLSEDPMNYEIWLKATCNKDLAEIVGTKEEEFYDYAYENYLISLGAKDIK